MLDKKDKLVMSFIFEKCEGGGARLISIQELVDYLGKKKYAVSTNEIEEIMISLSKEGLIDFVESDSKRGEVYCVSLKGKGKLFKKDQQKERRYASWIILRTALLTIFSFLLGLLLRAIF